MESLIDYKAKYQRYNGLIETFFRTKNVGDTFHLFHLEQFVTRMRKGPAQSVSRTLRKLRENKKINYKVINKYKSLYEVLPV